MEKRNCGRITVVRKGAKNVNKANMRQMNCYDSIDSLKGTAVALRTIDTKKKPSIIIKTK